MSGVATPSLRARQEALIDPESLPWPLTGVRLDSTLVPGLVNDLKINLDGIQGGLQRFEGSLPKDLPQTIAALSKLTLVAADLVESAIRAAIYLPQGFYYGNPLIPFSGTLPRVLSDTTELISAIPLAQNLLPAILAGVPAAVSGLSLPTLAPLALPNVGLPALPVASAGPIIPVAIPTTVLRQLPALVPSNIIAAIPTLVPTRALQAVPTNIPALLQPILPGTP